jgi:glyoxylase-like metal-dependent hydrolase (beta-lactamase superfamily II)
MDHYHFKVGHFDCTLLRDASGPRSVVSFMPSPPQDELERVIRQQGLDPDALDFSISPLLIRSGDVLLLVDTGEGGELPERLNNLMIDPAEIDVVVITHGHGDHVAGILNADGAFAFPNARYVFWQSEWDYWTADERLASAAQNHIKDVWTALKAHPDRIDLLSTDQPEAEIMPGICAVAAPGHTVGHIALELSSDGEKLLHIADAAHGYFQIACPQWSPKFDYDKEQAAVTRRALFERAARDGCLLSAYHFPFPGIGHVVERDGGLGWEQIPG